MTQSSQHRSSRRTVLHLGGLALLLTAVWLPIWVGPYPALYDYPAHLFEAHIALEIDKPGNSYAEGFVARPGWFAESNALFTLATIGLMQVAPIDTAGKLALSLSLAIFCFGLRGLLRRAGTSDTFLGLAPLLAYNFTFTSGWLNFSLAIGLGLCALNSYEEWRHTNRRLPLLWLTVLSTLIYSAHLMVWGLLALTLGIRAAADHLAPSRRLHLALSSLGPLFLIIPTQPILVLIILIGPAVWLGAWLIEQLRIPPLYLALAAPLGGALLFGLARFAEPWIQQLQPEIEYAHFPRITFLIRSFTLSQQLPEVDPLLSVANLLLSLLLPLITGMALYGAYRSNDQTQWRRLAPLGVLALLYGAVPSFAADIAVVEPRMMIWAALIGLGAIRLPYLTRLRRTLAAYSISASLIGITAFTNHAIGYQQQAERWRSTLAQLQPARSMVVVIPPSPPRTPPFRFIESYYDGRYFSTRYQLEWGGVTTRMFGNGPVYIRPDIEVAGYLWRNQRTDIPTADECSASCRSFDAVVAWGIPAPAQYRRLETCFGSGSPYNNLILWRP